MAAIMRPMMKDDTTATTSENFAVLGWAAPSSFDILTLHTQTLFNNHISDWFCLYVFIKLIYIGAD